MRLVWLALGLLAACVVMILGGVPLLLAWLFVAWAALHTRAGWESPTRRDTPIDTSRVYLLRWVRSRRPAGLPSPGERAIPTEQ